MGGTVWYIVMIPCCMLLSGIGVFSWTRKKPVWFWTEPRVSEAEISDVVKYNRENGVIVGFGDMSPNGYPDRFYVHRDFQRHGTARDMRRAWTLCRRAGNDARLNHGKTVFSEPRLQGGSGTGGYPPRSGDEKLCNGEMPRRGITPRDIKKPFPAAERLLLCLPAAENSGLPWRVFLFTRKANIKYRITRFCIRDILTFVIPCAIIIVVIPKRRDIWKQKTI